MCSQGIDVNRLALLLVGWVLETGSKVFHVIESVFGPEADRDQSVEVYPVEIFTAERTNTVEEIEPINVSNDPLKSPWWARWSGPGRADSHESATPPSVEMEGVRPGKRFPGVVPSC